MQLGRQYYTHTLTQWYQCRGKYRGCASTDGYCTGCSRILGNLTDFGTHKSTISEGASGIIVSDELLGPSPPRLAQKNDNNEENALLLGARADSLRSELSIRSPPSNIIVTAITTPDAGGYDGLGWIGGGGRQSGQQHPSQNLSQWYKYRGGVLGMCPRWMDILHDDSDFVQTEIDL